MVAIKKAEDTWRLRCVVPEEALAHYEAALAPYFDAFLCFEIEDDGPEHGKWQVDLYSDGPYEQAEVAVAFALAAQASGVPEPEILVEHQSPRDWLADNLQSFKPIQAGRFFIHGSHWQGLTPVGSVSLQINAATAFGSGEHQSTHGCLLALERLIQANFAEGFPECALDMGCGSGILGLATAKYWQIPVVAVDCDEESTRVAHDNAMINEVDNLVTVLVGDGFSDGFIRENSPYRLIFANILARPLCDLAGHIAESLHSDGRVILSGLLSSQEEMVLEAYGRVGLQLRERIVLDTWSTLILGPTR